MDNNLLQQAMDNMNKAQTTMSSIPMHNSQQEAKNYQTQMNNSTNKLEKETWYNDILNSYMNELWDQQKAYANLPLLATIKKQYTNKTPTEDIDALSQKMMEMRDTLDARVWKMASDKWVAVDPSQMYAISGKLKSFYDNQLNSLQQEKQNRIKDAETQAQIDYQDKVQNIRKLDNSLTNLKSMLDLSWRQVQDGKTDTRNALKLQQDYDKTNANLKKQLADTSSKLWISQLTLRQVIKGIYLKQKSTNSSINLQNAEINKINWDTKKQDLWNINKAYNIRTTQAIGTDPSSWLHIFETPTQWGKRYFDKTGKIDDWKHIWALANNPWDIIYNGQNWKYLQSLWASWIIKSSKWKMYAVFPDKDTWIQAISSVLNSPTYEWKTVKETLQTYVWEKEIPYLKLFNKNLLNQKLWNLNPSDKQQLIDWIIKWEQGWYKPWTYDPLATKTTTIIKPSDFVNTINKTISDEVNKNKSKQNPNGAIWQNALKQIFQQVWQKIMNLPVSKQTEVKSLLIKDHLNSFLWNENFVETILNGLSKTKPAPTKTNSDPESYLATFMKNNKKTLDNYVSYVNKLSNPLSHPIDYVLERHIPFTNFNDYSYNDPNEIIAGIKNDPKFAKLMKNALYSTITNNWLSNKNAVNGLWNMITK